MSDNLKIIDSKKYIEVLRKHIQAQQAMQDTFGRIGMPEEANQCEAFIDGLRRAIEVAGNMTDNA